jgi:hypothetical protein
VVREIMAALVQVGVNQAAAVAVLVQLVLMLAV